MEKKIVIVGGGFAGINLAQQLANVPGFEIVLVDKNNYNFFPPLLYQVATGFLEPSNISYPFRKFLHGKRNISFRLGELLEILPNEKKVCLSSDELNYDDLVIATGTETNYFGMNNIRLQASPMKTVDDAIELRNTLLQIAEAATIATDPVERRKLGTIVIAGGGPTGVEVAGMLAEMRKNILEKDYPELDKMKMRICLVDGSPTLLTPMSIASQQYTLKALIELGVEVRLNTQVKDFIQQEVILANGEKISARLLIWAAGVVSGNFKGLPADSFGRGHRVMVNEFNAVQGVSNIYAIGDTCLQTTDPHFPQGHPQLAQVAIQQGLNLASNFKTIHKGGSPKAFLYNDKGSMAIIGRNKAVAEIPKPKLQLKGWLAWMIWLFVHLISLINYRNKLVTLYHWMTAYFTKDQSLRMIIRPKINQE